MEDLFRFEQERRQVHFRRYHKHHALDMRGPAFTWTGNIWKLENADTAVARSALQKILKPWVVSVREKPEMSGIRWCPWCVPLRPGELAMCGELLKLGDPSRAQCRVPP
jgi:hypothetical protein